MAKEYAVFVESIQKDLAEGKEIVLTIKDLTAGPRKYDNRVVRALVYKSPTKLPDGDILRVRTWTGVLLSEPWRIKILGEMGEVVPGIPHGETLQNK